ncbi:DUF2829 domain-containing protein [candidate division KSB1 bacterium]|nr:DUF2829 domain-containing protein [candidate division KSB1 bacterium]
MNFSEALENMKYGKAVYREGWNGKGMYIAITGKGEYGPMSNPYIFMKTADPNGRFVPRIASQTDLLADDWKFRNPAVKI